MSTINNNIRRVLALVVALFTLTVASAADSRIEAEAEWQRALEAYSNGDFGAARDAFERVVELGYGGSKVYYNLGNTYYKLGQQGEVAFGCGELGRAVLNYRRALRINPSDADARYNLDLAIDQTNDAEPLPQDALSSLWASIRGVMSSNGWAIASVVELVLVLAFALLYLLSNMIVLRKVAFFVSIALFCVFLLNTLLSLSQRTVAQEDNLAVVVCNSVTSVHASPDNMSKVIRQPSQGVTVRVMRNHGEWSEIEFADGEKGWIPTSIIEKV
jgi:tetratricopeptide (TPR) repeat protein